MTEIGEAVSVALGPGPPQPPPDGRLTVQVTERSSGEPVEGVTVKATGLATASGTTDANGEADLGSLPPGAYLVELEQDEFEMTPDSATASVEPGGEERLEVRVNRVLLTAVLKRIHIQGLFKAATGDKSELEYGHWWIELDGSESYGWWPSGPVGIGGTLKGVPGKLNGGPRFGGGPTRDPHHGDSAEQAFHPRVRSGAPAADVKSCVRSFAKGYSGTWSWPWGQNCHSFQRQMMRKCALARGGSKKANGS